MNKINTRNMTTIGLMSALLCIIGPFSIPLPFSPVPIVLSNLMIYISCSILGTKKGTLSVIIYLLIGLVGLPVFSGFTSGLSKIAGPTGGYLIGYIFCAIITGLFVEKFEDKIYMYAIGMILGTLICYAFGTIWLAKQLSLTFMQALFMGVIPYLIGDSLKIMCGTLIGFKIRNKLNSLKLIYS